MSNIIVMIIVAIFGILLSFYFEEPYPMGISAATISAMAICLVNSNASIIALDFGM